MCLFSYVGENSQLFTQNKTIRKKKNNPTLSFLADSRVTPAAMTTLAAIQSWPEVPALAHFCSLFKTAFDLLEFEIEELETALLSVDSVQEDMFACTLLERLVVRLLRGCLPATIAAQVHEGNFSLYLRQLLETKQEEAEEEGQMYSFRDPFQVWVSG